MQWSVRTQETKTALGEDSRRCINIQQDVAILELLGIRASLEVLLKGVLAHMVGSDRGDGRRVDEGVLGALSSHG